MDAALGNDGMREILEDFFSEADESLDAVEQDLIRLEAEAEGGREGDAETVDRLFRALHNLKGSAGFLGLEKLAAVAHSGEGLLDGVRSRDVEVGKPVVDALLQASDTLKALLHLQKIGGDLDEVDVVAVCGELDALAGVDGVEEELALSGGEEVEDVGEEGVQETVATPLVRQILEDPRLEDPEGGEDEDEPQPVADEAPVRAAVEEVGEETSLRVDTAKLDALVNLAGELTLSRNALVQQLQAPEALKALAGLPNGEAIEVALQRVNRVTQELQRGILATRMQPLARVFDRMPRLVRDLKERLHKKVNLIVEGDHVEADKVLVEALADPLVHLVRNAVDHGIESPSERKKAGKHLEGTVTLRAFHEGNMVVVEVQDDGAGMDPQALRARAVERGLMSAAEAARLDDAQALRLVLAPGFSTSDEVSEVSGRGVGLDVVAAGLQALQGRLEIESEAGVGTCFRLRLPLTLAIVNALVVGDRREGYAIPLRDIAEVVNVKASVFSHVNGAAVMDLRGEVVALRHLRHFDRPQAELPERGYVVVVRENAKALGLIVDELLGQEEMVVKSLNRVAGGNKAVAGASVTGDGGVHMILDIPMLLKSEGFSVEQGGGGQG